MSSEQYVIIFNALIPLIISLVSFFLFKKLRVVRENNHNRSLSFFWLSYAITFFLVFVIDINALVGEIVGGSWVMLVNQFFAAFTGYYLLSFGTEIIFSKKPPTARMLKRLIFFPAMLVFVLLNLANRWSESKATRYGTEYLPPDAVLYYFGAVVGIIVFLLILAGVSIMKNEKKNVASRNSEIINIALIIIILFFSGVDEFGIFGVWLALIRISILGIAIAAFLNEDHLMNLDEAAAPPV